MSFVLKQVEFIRSATLQAVEDLNEAQLDVIPEGFNNNIRWNLGHIYVVQERFSFGCAGQPMKMPEGFEALFGNGTKPADWKTQPPSLSVLTELLKEQSKRVEEGMKEVFTTPVEKPFTTKSGLSLTTVGEFINFSLYHEGLHLGVIKSIKRLV